ncbi:glycosyltransferase family 39 protein [Thalassoglobus polymorphus]|uniref:Uncharacterized protein n=1 Tax=Thalassoglobus polymorphus TaxID=2527994 RepID=A0A517QJJ1_9PLAN|nr:glycosyltransferase family 39 protein [Thalassoglobus polymorphus]QDT31812.1 hypothetical protein Mal48_10480 [Thalassoglobus polymorphus]
MASRNRLIESLFCALFGLCGVSLLVLAIPDVGLRFAARLVPSELWNDRSQTLSCLLLIYALLFFAASLYLLQRTSKSPPLWSVLRREFIEKSRQLLSFLRRLPETFPRLLPVPLLLLMGLGAFVRFKFLNQPMRYDESYTYLEYINRAPQYLFLYSDPNNHVGHTLLVKLSTLIFGSSPIGLRLPAFLAGLCSIPVGFHVAKRMLSQNAGYLFAALIALFPYFILFDTNGRGYSLVVLLSLIQILLSLRSDQELPSPLLFAFVTACGLFVMPSYLFFAAGIVLWLIVVRIVINGPSLDLLKRFLVRYSVACLLMAFVLYSPVILVSDGISPIVANRFVESLSWGEFASRLPSHLAETVQKMSRGIPTVGLALFVLCFLIGTIASIRKRDWQAALFFPTVVLGGLVVLILKRAIPFDRTWIFLLPIFLLQVANGFVECLTMLRKSPERTIQLVQVVSFMLVLGMSFFLIRNDVITKFEDTGSYPEAEDLAKLLVEWDHSGESIGMSDPLLSVPVNYYLAQLGVESISVAEKTDAPMIYFLSREESPEEFDVGAYLLEQEFGQTSVYRQHRDR